MSYIQIGELYLVKQYFWFLYSTKERAAHPRLLTTVLMRRRTSTAAGRDAKLLSESFNCNVFVVEPNTYVVLLQADHDYYKLLDCNGNIGWIGCWEFSKYFELVKAKQ